MKNNLHCDYVESVTLPVNHVAVPVKPIQVTLNGFTFEKNVDGTDNIQSVLKNKDNKALGGIVKDAKKMANMKRLKASPDVLAFLAKVQEDTELVYFEQKKAKPYNKYKKKFNPCIHSINV